MTSIYKPWDINSLNISDLWTYCPKLLFSCFTWCCCHLDIIASSAITAFFSCLSTGTITGWLAITILSVSIWRYSGRIIAWLFLITYWRFYCTCAYLSCAILPILGANVHVYYVGHLIIALQVCLTCLHLAPCCHVLQCVRGMFAQSPPCMAPNEVK